MTMRTPMRIIATLLFFIFITNSNAQDNYYHIRPFHLLDKMPSSYIKFALQDHYGLMWFGTEDGLCRYDGYQLHIYRSNSSNGKLLSSNNILVMTEYHNYILIGTDAGLNVLDRNTNTIRMLKYPDLDGDKIQSIAIDKNGYIWIGTYKRLVRLSPDMKRCKRYDSRGVPVTSVNSIMVDKQGTIWAMFWEKGLYRYNPQKDRFEHMPKIGKKDNPFRIFQDNMGRYWLSTWGEGIFSMHMNASVQLSYTPINLGAQNEYLSNNYFSIVQDKTNGYIWMIGSKGLSIAKPSNDSLKLINIVNLQHLMNDVLESVFCDRSGNLWITGLSSMFYINMNTMSIFNYPFSSLALNYGETPILRALYVDQYNNIWTCQERRGLIFCKSNGYPRLFTSIPLLSKLENLSDIISINRCSDIPDAVWILPEFDDNVYIMKQNKGITKIFKTFHLGHEYFPRVFHEDVNHNVWISTIKGLMIKLHGQRFQQAVGKIPTDVISIATDDKGHLWLASKSEGLYGYNVTIVKHQVKLQQMQHATSANSLLTNNHIVSICLDKTRDLLWIATAEGAVLTYNWKTKKMINLTENFISYINTQIQNIIVDRKGNIWIKTNRSLLKYNPQSKINIEYNTEDGITVKSYKENAVFYDGNNYIYVGGYGGLARININNATYKSKENENSIVSDVKVNEESFLNGTLKKNNLCLENKSIFLDNDAGNIEIDFTTCDYAYPKKIIFAYKLEGIDQDWNYTTTERHYAFYNYIPKGTHKLLIKSTDANGVWSNKIVTYIVYRRPSFYETWWAYSIYIFLIVAVLYIVYWASKRRIRINEHMRRLQMEQEKEEELTQTKLQYFTNISHDFLTPITIISCIIDDIFITSPEKDNQPQSLIVQLKQIKINLLKLKHLIQQVLDFRKLEKGKMVLEVQSGELVSFISSIYNNYFEPLVRQKNLHFFFDTQIQELPSYFDPDKLDRIIMNFLSNAYKYTNQGEIRIKLKQIIINRHRYATISISDTGKGIEIEDQKHVFDRFYAVDHHLSESNGIGLSLVKELATLHHATIEIESKVGVGSTFTINLPIDAECYSAEELNMDREMINAKKIELEAPTTLIEETDNGIKVGKMLIVEDNSELLNYMYKIFSRYHKVSCSINGKEAFNKVKEDMPDIIISDVMMPEMDGLELCRILKNDKETSHIPIILLTARTNPEDRIACYNAGADGYITKPFELNVLKARIDNFLRNKGIQQKQLIHNNKFSIDDMKATEIDKELMKKAINLIEQHINETALDVNFLAEQLYMSNSTLYRKIKGITGLSPVSFIRNVRLKYAYRELSKGEMSITDIAYNCGFSTPSYFSTCFKTEFGISPMQLKK